MSLQKYNLKIKHIIKTSRFCFKKAFLTPNGPLTREFDPTSPHSYLSHGNYLTNKHYHFKKITQNNN